MWCLPVGNPWRQHHQCASSTKAAPSLLPSTSTVSSKDGRHKRSTDSTQASTLKFRFRPDNVVAQIIDPLVGAASCQDLRGKGSASSQGDCSCGRRCGRRPPRPLRPPRMGGERNPNDSKHDDCAWTWVPSVKTVAGADSRISAGPAGRVQLEKIFG